MIGRVLIDGRTLQGLSAVRGIGSYTRGLLRGLAGVESVPQVDLMVARRADPPPESREPPVAGCVAVATVRQRVRPLFDPFAVAAALARHRGYNLYHATEWGQPLVGLTPTVVTVHDLIPFLFADDFRWMRRNRLLALRLLRHADAVITPSQCTADDVVHHAAVKRDRVTIVPHGVDPAFAPSSAAALDNVRRRFGLPQRYVLAVGVFDAHKRMDVLIETVARLRRDHDIGLAIAGAQAGYEPLLRSALARAGLTEHTVLLGHVSGEALVALYGAASCLLHTSAYEGFGLPLLEAMASGCPVAAFVNSSIPEVTADAALLVEDGDATALAGAASRLLADSDTRERYVAAGIARAATFTWERTARATLDVYRSVAR